MFDLLNTIDKADLVLIGIGTEWSAEKHTEEELITAYSVLHELVKKKPHFVVTLNTDDLIYRGKFYKGFVTAPCGSIHRFQCEKNCSGKLFDQDPGVCPDCGAPIITNTIDAGAAYNEEGYLSSWKSYNTWITGTIGKKVLILELGADFYFHQIIRIPFEKITNFNQNAYLVRVNELFPMIPEEIADRALPVQESSLAYVMHYAEGEQA